jgi:signal peptidase
VRYFNKDSRDGEIKILTKGDNNEVHDRGLYNRGQKWLTEGDIVGRARGYNV